jgi:ornithine carbamoyltransferase
MEIDLRGRDFLGLLDYSELEIRYLLDLAKYFKQLKKSKSPHRFLVNKNIVTIFEKDSTRTRCSFDVAAFDLGMGVTYLGPTGSQIGKKETIADTARVLCRMYEGIEYRGFSQELVEELAKYSSVPVWNGLTDKFHPTQMLADFLTMEENFGHLKGLELVFVGDIRNNSGNSLMVMSAKMGVNFTACGPKELWPDEDLLKTCREIAQKNGSTITVTDNLLEATKDKDAIYADVWLSMGDPPEEWEARINLLKSYQITKDILDNAKDSVIFLHALPSFHNQGTTIAQDIQKKFGISEMEVTDEVFESSHSKVFDEAENRMHTIKAVIYATIRD